MNRKITVIKSSRKRLNAENIYEQLNEISSRTITPTRAARGWSIELSREKEPRDNKGEYLYYAFLEVTCNPKKKRDKESIETEFNNIVKIISKAGNSTGWILADLDGTRIESIANDKDKKVIGYFDAIIPKDWKDHFSEVYERDDHIDIITSSIQAGIDSDWTNRFHAVLHGDPASGKTEILRCVKSMMGEDAYLEYDATATTHAGAIKDLARREYLPRLLLIEEIEKADEASLRWLLSVMDHRAEIRKVNYREKVFKETKLLTLATVNNYSIFKNLMSGALASRFAHHVYCPLPNRNLLGRILNREVSKLKHGRVEWIKPALDFSEEQKISDPRTLLAICLCGKDNLLNGTYQQKLLKCRK